MKRLSIKKGLSIISLLLSLILVLTLAIGCTTKPEPTSGLSGKLPIYHAGSLTIPFAQISEEFNKLYNDKSLNKIITWASGLISFNNCLVSWRSD